MSGRYAAGWGKPKHWVIYAASLLAGDKAHQAGYTQVLWLDGVEFEIRGRSGLHEYFFRDRR